MLVKTIVQETYQDYKKPAMLISTCYCDWKCCNEQNISNSICHNKQTTDFKNIKIDNNKIIEKYLNNPLTEAIIFGGLEPMKQFEEVIELISEIREKTLDDIVIYTGYYPYEIVEQLNQLSLFRNIIIKFGRYLINSEPIFDEVLGIKLASKNQYAIKIS